MKGDGRLAKYPEIAQMAASMGTNSTQVKAMLNRLAEKEPPKSKRGPRRG